MMEQDSWSHRPDDVFAASGDAGTAEDMPGLQIGDAGISNHCFKSSNITSDSELCTDDGIPKDASAAVDSNSYNYPPSHIHQSADLNLFSNDCDDKQSSDLLYYGWPDIGNFEDVDRMLSNCDSSFGLGVTGSGDELVWFTSEDPAGGYEEALKMDLKFPCSESSALTNMSQDNGPHESDNRSSFVSESEDQFKLKDQKKQSKQQNQTEGKKAGRCVVNYGLKSNDIRLSSSDESDQVFTSIGNWQQNKSLEHDSFRYKQSSSYLHSGHDHVPMQTNGAQVMTGIKSENKGLAAPFRKEASNATNQVHSVESLGDSLFQGAAFEISERRKVHHAHASQPSLSGNQKQMGMMLQASGNDLFSSQKQFHILEKKPESQNDMEEVKKGASAELAMIGVPEGSSISSEVDEISLEATSFLQLQQVMEQLDLSTKLCIRDSLYRLARSAEQRHNYAGIRDRTTNCGATDGPLMTEGTDKCTGFMDIETDTNPIDRTIAHLLFHRPSDSSNKPTPLPLKPNTKVHGSTTGPPMVAEELSYEEGANESDDKISNSGKN
ncbi:protein LNK1-like isoform X3 [Cynara cardunculus var. scolymus]|nr:protein LNK1-like isoform X3 [Cynara cardunculus var. scolymus]XP_024959458.1 protein LNK1-like isoform X3 [Cynara cardunculus var. scolymus]